MDGGGGQETGTDKVNLTHWLWAHTAGRLWCRYIQSAGIKTEWLPFLKHNGVWCPVGFCFLTLKIQRERRLDTSKGLALIVSLNHVAHDPLWILCVNHWRLPRFCFTTKIGGRFSPTVGMTQQMCLKSTSTTKQSRWLKGKTGFLIQGGAWDFFFAAAAHHIKQPQQQKTMTISERFSGSEKNSSWQVSVV